MSIYTASQASSTVAEISTASQQASQSVLVAQYQSVFDAIQKAAQLGQTQVQLRWTKRQYSQAVALFASNGYSVTSPPTDGVNSNDNVIQYPLTITWPAVVPGPAITSILPTSVTASVNVPFRVEFVPQGGTAPYTFTVSGVIPNGLTFSNLVNSNTLVLSGTPTTVKLGINSMTIAAADSASQSFSQIVSWNITQQGATLLNTVTNNAQQAALGLIIGLS
jgi:Putative Ig domain